jgi:hypothetical protein
MEGFIDFLRHPDRNQPVETLAALGMIGVGGRTEFAHGKPKVTRKLRVVAQQT